jgi:hypothetical protein
MHARKALAEVRSVLRPIATSRAKKLAKVTVTAECLG